MKSILIYGGTFDPPHNGHLFTASSIQTSFNFDDVYFIPCKNPELKSKAKATENQRIDMLKIALSSYKDFRIDLREIKRSTPSYMVETLQSLRKEHKKFSITLVVGTDVFLQLPQWYQWQELFNLSHILVIKRPLNAGEEISDELADMIAGRITTDKNNLLTKPYGSVFFFNAGLYDISSKKIREQISAGQSIEEYVPYSVHEYIKKNNIY